ncbi:MAG: type VI secretion system protein TssA, partial [Desulfobacteraceae bacterium]|nr:type VI secretion system protein TssA [Desulfobacteraceae bacterium]
MELLELGKTPVSEDEPAGKDVRYEPGFEDLSKEMSKMGTISGGSEIDWDNVVSLSSDILEKESKHLQVACYLCYGLIKTKGIEGLFQGVHILKELLENFWEPMFPPKKRMKGRRGILAWWEEKTSDFINDLEAVTWEKEKRDEFIGNFNAIDEFLGENMEDAPLLLPLIKRIKSAVNEKKEESAAEAGSNENSSGADTSQKTSASNISMDSDISADAMLEHGFDVIGKSASNLIAEDPFDPVPYRLNRIAAWIPIEDLPTATGGKTMIPPPDDQIVSAMATLYDNSNWEDLADSCESNVRQFLFWLDLSRYVAECMEQLGHEDVCRAIEMETALFVGRLKGIEQMCFSDGTPFADGVTREWLSKIIQNSSDDTSGTGTADSLKQLISQQMNEAQQLIKQKKPDQAIALLMDCSSKSRSERERFLWKMNVCRVLINLKKIQIAASFIDDMLDYIEKFKLEIWEPDNAIEALSLALTGLRLQKNDRHESLIESIIKKISMLDP